MPAPTYAIDPALDNPRWCTARQAEYIRAVNRCGGMRKAARELGVPDSVVSRSIAAVRRKAALCGYSPEHQLTRPVAPGQMLRGVSQLYRRGEAEPVLEWVKTRVDDEARLEIIREWVDWLTTDAKGKSPRVAPPKHADEDLLAVYPLGDPHFGMYAWAQEAGDDFDLAEAERLTCSAIDRLVASAPAAHTGLLINLGDFFHADDSRNVTPGHGNTLDVDSRYAKVLQVGLRAVVHCIKAMLAKHQRVVGWMLPGNHDPHASFALALALDAFFSADPRVEIDLSPGMFRYMEFGRVLLGAHHGHTTKAVNLPAVMACDQAEAWGRTRHRHWYCGHVHHKSRDKEHPGVTVETFRTLAARDAWHTGQGYRAGRDANLIVLHREYGEIQRTRCDISMLGAKP